MRRVRPHLVRIRNRLQRRRADAHHQVVAAAGDFPGDRVGRADIPFRVETFELHAPASDVATGCQFIDHSLDPILEHRQGGMLDQCDPEHFRSPIGRRSSQTRALAGTGIGVQQYAGGQRDENRTERETFNGFKHATAIVDRCAGGRADRRPVLPDL